MELITAFLIIVGIILHLYNNRLYLYYYLWLYFFVPFILSLTLNLDFDEFQYLTNHTPIFLLGIFLIELIRNRFKMLNRGAVCAVLFFTSYIVLGAVWHDAPLSKYIIHIIITMVIPFFCLSHLFYWNPPDWVKLDKVVTGIFYIELTVAFLQQFLGLFVPDFLVDSITRSKISGTFIRANFFGMFFLLLLFYMLLKKCDISYKQYTICLLSFIVILLSGIRTYLLCFIIFIPLCFYLKSKFKAKKLTLMLLLPLLLIPLIFFSRINSEGYSTGDADNPIQRQIYGLSNLARGEAIDVEQSTMFLSFYVFTEYFIKNPIMGSWLLYTDSSYNLVSPENHNIMDAGLAVYLSDIGILGMGVYIMFQLITLLWKTYGNCRKYILLIYLYALLATYTDIGIFGGPFMCCVFIVVNLLNNEFSIKDYKQLKNTFNK